MTQERFNEIKGNFPSYLPQNLLERELHNIEETEVEVYRVCKYGFIDKSFVTTYKEVHSSDKPLPKNYDENDISTYSMSCFKKERDVKRIFRLFKKHDEYKDICMSIGKTKSEIGVVRFSKKYSHVDFWLYDNVKPIEYFSKIEVDW